VHWATISGPGEFQTTAPETAKSLAPRTVRVSVGRQVAGCPQIRGAVGWIGSARGVGQCHRRHLGAWILVLSHLMLLLASRVHVHDGHLQTLVMPRSCHGVDRCPLATLGGASEQGRAADLRAGLTTTAAEQVAVVVATKLATEKVERQWVDARVDERQAVGEDLEDVPEHVVLGRVEVVPEVPDVTRQPADDEDHHE